MKVSFFIGVIISILAMLIGFLSNDYNITFKITGILSVIGLIIAGILNGTFISGDRYRANLLSGTKEDNNRKIKIVNYLLLLVSPNIIVVTIIFIYTKYFSY